MKNNLAIFEKFKVRKHFDEEKQKWFFSVIDIVAVLTDQTDFDVARNYWKVLKHRLIKEGSELVTNCNQLKNGEVVTICDQLKMMASDGKFYKTDVADIQTIFRLIQSIPSPKAEPIKMWLAKVGNERINEIGDPELSLNRARENW